MSLIASIQTLTPGSIIHVYEIETADGTYVRFSGHQNANNAPIQMYDYDNNSQLNTYYQLPIVAEGFEKNNSGAIARPKLRVGIATSSTNPQVSFKAAVGSFESLLGKKMVRRTTFSKYVKGGTSETASGATPVEFNRECWIIDKVASEDADMVEFELNHPFDMDGVMLPKRTIVGNGCSWEYQGASPTRAMKDRIGGCTWHEYGQYYRMQTYGGTSTKQYTAYVNVDDHYIVPNSGILSWDSLSSSGTVSTNSIYSKNETVTRISASGDLSSVTKPSYWQARSTGTKTAKGTPSPINSNFVRCYVYDDYNSSTTYYKYTTDKFNDYVRHGVTKNPPDTTFFPSSPSNGDTTQYYGLEWTYVSANTAWEATCYTVWQTKETHSGNTPGFGEYWKRGDVCGKRLTSCNRRFNATPISTSQANSNPKADHENIETLPFGAFPGSKNFN